MRKERVHTWYIQPRDEKTNQALSRIPSAEYQEQLSGGGPEGVWECKYRIVNGFMREKVKQGYSFNVFVKEGDNGPVKPAESFLPLKKRTFVPSKIRPARSRQAAS
ncbi:MAG: hypothetical protein Q7S28_01125 [bacterium]|nr:hypothetical protein [bacterium]